MPDIRKLLKNGNNRSLAIICIIGVVIILLSGMFSDKEDSDNAEKEFCGEEERLVEILQKIDGAGRVSVMITYEEIEKSGGIGYSNSEIVKTPKGVIVVADGAGEPNVRSDLKEAATAVMGVGANHVCVYKRENSK